VLPANNTALNRYKREQHGHENHLAAIDPPPVNTRPFNSIKVHYVQETDQQGIAFDITTQGISKFLLSQLGLTTQAQSIVVMKIRRIDVFATQNQQQDNNVRPACTIDCSSLVPQLADPATPGNAVVFYPILKKLSDIGSQSKPARVSYTWPLSQSDVPVTQQANFTVCTISSNVKATDVYIHLHWSTTDVGVPTPD